MAEGKGGTAGFIVGGCGTLLLLLSLVSAAFWGYLVAQDSGAIDAEEAAPGVAASCFCAFVFLVIAVVGFAMGMRARKKAG